MIILRRVCADVSVYVEVCMGMNGGGSLPPAEGNEQQQKKKIKGG